MIEKIFYYLFLHSDGAKNTITKSVANLHAGFIFVELTLSTSLLIPYVPYAICIQIIITIKQLTRITMSLEILLICLLRPSQYLYILFEQTYK